MNVKVRMYRSGGLGDCFLLTFSQPTGLERYILIDCGVFFGTPNARQRMRQIAQNIFEVTKGEIEILVATHEHWDHLSGFSFAQDIFEQINIKEVWVAWTEDKQNPLARKLKTERNQAFAALHSAATQLQAAGDPRADEIIEVLSFSGPLGTNGEIGTAEQIALVQTFGEVKYCRPGQPSLGLADFPGLRIYVLGPPEDETLIQKSKPRKGQVYEKDLAAANNFYGDEYSQFYAATSSESENLEEPFHKRFKIPLSEAGQHREYGAFFKEKYGFGSEQNQGPAWRRINSDWLRIADQLSLNLDNNTNNTSLVLAFELAEDKVLLFPGDAQVGNWLSWEKLSWKEENRTITGTDLIKRTVLYKVGHHGSHNATLSVKGLELMEREELVALIPVDESQAKNKRWAMPFLPLYARLQDKTQGRILRADTGILDRPDFISQARWQAFLDRVQEDESNEDLWLELSI